MGDSSTGTTKAQKNNRNLVASAINAQEEERGRIAREIHDGPAQSLASMVLRIEIIQKLMEFDKGQAFEELDRLKDSLRASLSEVRKIIYDLRPLSVEESGLAEALSTYLRGWEEKSGIKVAFSWEAPVGERFPAEVETTLYRLVQECLSNAAKHSGASLITITVRNSGDSYDLTIKDNGKGFDVERQMESAKARARFGLIGMFERVQLLGGRIGIDSAEGSGTVTRVSIPN